MGFIVWIMVFAIFGSILTVLMMWIKSQRLRIRDPLNRRNYVEDYWMMEKKDKATGVVFWKSVFWQKKIVTQEPPKEAINVGKKGRKIVECYRLTEDEFVWITDKGIKIEKDDQGKLTAYNMDGEAKGQKIDSFEPFTSTQRQALVNQYIKADEISKKRWSTAEVMGVISMGGLVMVIICILIFGGELLQAYDDTMQFNQGAQQYVERMMEKAALVMEASGCNIEGLDIILAQTPTSQGETNIIDTGTSEEPPSSNDFDVRDSFGLD